MSDQYAPRLEIPESPGMRQLNPVTLEFKFDGPREYEGERWTTYYYTVVSLPDGTEYSLAASSGLHNRIQAAGQTRGTVLSIARIGSGKNTVWDVEYVSGPRKSAETAPAPNKRSGNSNGAWQPATSKQPQQIIWKPTTQEKANVMLAIAEDYLELWEVIYTLVTTRPKLDDLSEEQKARIATGAFINASRIYRDGMVISGEEPDGLGNFIRDIDSVASSEDLVDTVINSITENTDMDTRKEVILLLKEFGLSSHSITQGEREDLIKMFNICDHYCQLIGAGMEEEYALRQVASNYDVEYGAVPF